MRSGWTIRMLLFSFLLGMLSVVSGAQSAPLSEKTTTQAPVQPKLDAESEKDRNYGIELYRQGKHLDALPWFEKVLQKYPNDVVSLELKGAGLLSKSQTLEDPAARKRMRAEARQFLVKAKEAGDESDLCQTLIAMIKEDGGELTFSSDPEIDRIMQKAEGAFGRGDLEEAKRGYEQVILLDPNHYDAALFLGDVYYRQKNVGAAGEWYSKASKINPNRETAYRYWADALLSQGKFDEARSKYIEALIAEPYNRATWNGLNNYLNATNLKATWYKIQSPNSVTAKDPTHININIDPNSLNKKDGSSAWFMYGILRATWVGGGENFKKAFPDEKVYRHSLKEEYSALSLVADSAAKAEKEKHEKLTDDLKALVRLNKVGLLEPYILLNCVDDGIAKDYEGYRKEHRDKLLQYLSEIVVPPAPKSSN